MAAAAAPASENRLMKSYRRSWVALGGTVLLLLIVLTGILAPWLAPHDPGEQSLPARLRPPIGVDGYLPGYYLGTDRLGRDVLSNMLYGIRVSVVVGVAAIGLSAVIGILLGMLSGYFGRRFDAFIMRAADITLAIPTILLALAVLAVWGQGLGKLILVVGLHGWAPYARTARGSTLAMREKDFVEGAMAVGVPDWLVMVRHILPNIVSPLVILIAVEIPRVVLLEATLSFLGLGVPTEVPSLGKMIADGYQVLFSGRWWLSVFPGAVLMLMVFAINMIGDWLRDALDPRLQGVR